MNGLRISQEFYTSYHKTRFPLKQATPVIPLAIVKLLSVFRYVIVVLVRFRRIAPLKSRSREMCALHPEDAIFPNTLCSGGVFGMKHSLTYCASGMYKVKLRHKLYHQRLYFVYFRAPRSNVFRTGHPEHCIGGPAGYADHHFAHRHRNRHPSRRSCLSRTRLP